MKNEDASYIFWLGNFDLGKFWRLVSGDLESQSLGGEGDKEFSL